MAELISISDFTGEEFLQEDLNTSDWFDQILNQHARPFVRQLLGVELGNLFLANWDTVVGDSSLLDARFKAIWDAFQEDCGSSIVESKGMQFSIKGILWFYYARQNNSLVTTGGNHSQLSENSTPTNDGIWMAKNYNEAIRTARMIQWYICDNSSDYPEYNGQHLDFYNGLG